MMNRRPKTIKEWRHDQPGEELYLVCIMDNRTVLSACGRYAQGSGSTECSWDSFLQGELNDLVAETMGHDVLREVLEELRQRIDDC